MSTRLTLPTSRPTDAPSFRIFSNGSQIPGEYLVAAIIVDRSVNRLSTAEILIHDGDPAASDFPASNASEFAPSTTIRVEMGYHQDEEIVFEGVVVKQKIQFSQNESYFRLECKDVAYKLSLGRNNRYFYEQKDSEIIESILREKGLSNDVASTEFIHPEMVQYNVSDWDFILSRADANGMMIYTQEGKVVAKKPDFSQDPALELQYGATIIEMEADLDGRYQYSSVEAHAWDAANQEMINNGATNSPATSPGDLSSSTLSADTGLDTLNLYHSGQLVGQELQAWASAERQRSQMAKMRGRVRIQGFNKITPGDMIDLGGLGERFSGQAFVSGVRHEFNKYTWETEILFGISPECFARQYEDILPIKAEGLVPAMNGLHIAVVTKLEQDPQGEHRVKVRIPVIDQQSEGTWARVANLDAGNDRGFFFRPEIGDEVVIGFLNDDPRNPVILGQLHSSNKPAPFQAEDVNHEKGYVSREKLKMVFNDDKKSIFFETPGGKSILMDDDAGEIKIEDKNGNKIILNSDGITIDSASKLVLKAAQDADLEAGANATIKASAQLKASGSAGAEFSASGNTVVKGAIVQIN